MRIHRHRQRKPKLNIQQYKANARIRAEVVRVIDDEGGMLGEMPTEKAIELAQSKEMDLVEVSPKAQPPVCKIIDYGQFKYQKEKDARKQKAQQKEVGMKAVRLSIRIGEHDRSVRLKQASKFLSRGDKVKVELPLRGREKAHRDLAQEVVQTFVNDLGSEFQLKVEQAPKYQGGRFTAIVVKA
jgi:translation initiation factor IF-3